MNAVSMQSSHVDLFAVSHLPAKEAWPELIFTLPQLAYPSRLNCTVSFLEAQCQQGFENKIALYGEHEAWTYQQLLQKVNQIAQVLVNDLHLVTGNRVLLRGTNSLMMAASILAVMKAGCIAVPTMPLLRAKELAFMLEKAQINAVLCDASLQEELQLACQQQTRHIPIRYFAYHPHTSEHIQNAADLSKSVESLMQQHAPEFIAVDTSAEDICLISFTSGTTGIPKASMHFHRDLLVICDCFPRSVLHTQSSDIFIGTSALAFTFGLGGLLLFPLRVGASSVLLEKPTPEKMVTAIAQYQASICFSVPTFYRQMLPLIEKNNALTSLQKTISAGEYLSVKTRQDWQEKTGLMMIDGLGTTELLHVFISAANEQIKSGATGKVVAGYQAKIINAHGQECAPHEVGALAIKGPTGCRYLNDARQDHYVVNGWNMTGDAYCVDEEGHYFYHGRTDDMIISAGYNIASIEIEDVLMQHPSIKECAVIGVPDEARGHIVKACIVLHNANLASTQLKEELQAYVRQQIAPFKYPRAIEWLSSLPRTETGKIQRYRLKTP